MSTASNFFDPPPAFNTSRQCRKQARLHFFFRLRTLVVRIMDRLMRACGNINQIPQRKPEVRTLPDRVDMVHDRTRPKPPARFRQLVSISRTCTDSGSRRPPLARVVESCTVFIPPFPIVCLMTLRLARAGRTLLHQSPTRWAYPRQHDAPPLRQHKRQLLGKTKQLPFLYSASSNSRYTFSMPRATTLARVVLMRSAHSFKSASSFSDNRTWSCPVRGFVVGLPIFFFSIHRTALHLAVYQGCCRAAASPPCFPFHLVNLS